MVGLGMATFNKPVEFSVKLSPRDKETLNYIRDLYNHNPFTKENIKYHLINNFMVDDAVVIEYRPEGGFQIVILDLKGKVNYHQVAEFIYNNKYPHTRSYGTHTFSIECFHGWVNVDFTVVHNEKEFDNYLLLSKRDDLKLYEANKEENNMKQTKTPKQKQRNSTKVVITYTNGKTYKIKNVLGKVSVGEKKVVVNYSDVQNLGGVVLISDKIKANIPTKDIDTITVLPVNRFFPDNIITFKNGKVVKNEINQVQGEYQGSEGYVSF